MLRHAHRASPYYRKLPLARTIEELPELPLSDFLHNPERFEVADAPRPPKPRFTHSLASTPRIAIVGYEMVGSWHVRNFSSFRAERLHKFAPQVVATPVEQLGSLAERMQAGECHRTPRTQALIVFIDPQRGFLTAQERDRFWKIFQVPLFEQLRGFGGELLAQECEGHCGLHIICNNAIFEITEEGQLAVSFLENPRIPLFRLRIPRYAALTDLPCICGQTSPRLQNIVQSDTEWASRRRPVVVNS